MHRLFVALRPPASIRGRLAAMMRDIPGARWQSDEQLHVTLRFIGEVDRPQADDIAAALDSVHHPALEIGLDGVGRFEREGGVEAIWAGVGPRGPLAALHRKIDHMLAGAGLPPEGRAYLPHITLARFSRTPVAQVEDFLASAGALSSPPAWVGEFGLYESVLGRGGALYTLVERYRLG